MIVIRDKAELTRLISLLRTGDQLFFGGSGWWSEAIDAWTDSVISHCATWSEAVEAWTDSVISHCATVIAEGSLRWLIEMLPGGIRVSSLRHRVEEAEDCWAALLRRASRPKTDPVVWRATEFLGMGVKYDYGAIRSYFFGNRPKEDSARLYCSELSGILIRESGLLPREFSAALTPQEVAMLRVYEPDYYCLAWKNGAPKEIRGFNSMDPREGLVGRSVDMGERRNGG